MKVILCCIARLEHDYINEFVKWYADLGVEKVVVYDNGQGDEPTFDGVLSEFIESGLVEIIDYRNRAICQDSAYDNCYLRYGGNCDWMMFFDCDEFLSLKKHKTIDEYLSMDLFNEFDVIGINWTMYGDNGLIKKKSNKVVKRFKEPTCTPSYFNNFVKTIVRGRLNGIRFKDAHGPYEDGLRICCEDGTTGITSLPYAVGHECQYATLNHYATKSLQEYIGKLKRGYPDRIDTFDIQDLGTKIILNYWSINEYTDEKEKYIQDNLGIIIDYDCPLFQEIRRRKQIDLDNQNTF